MYAGLGGDPPGDDDGPPESPLLFVARPLKLAIPTEESAEIFEGGRTTMEGERQQRSNGSLDGPPPGSAHRPGTPRRQRRRQPIGKK
jgi:hypothetical protein